MNIDCNAKPSGNGIDPALPSGRRTENLILNHMSNIALRTGQLPEKMTSLVTGNPPLWITRDRKGIYANQAKVLAENIEGRSERGDEQVGRSELFSIVMFAYGNRHVLIQRVTQRRHPIQKCSRRSIQ